MPYQFYDRRIRGGVAADDRYWENLEDGAFALPRCAECRRWQWPAHYRCGFCGSWDFQWEQAPMTGTVYSWTRTHAVFDRTQGRKAEVPYVVVLSEIDGTGARVLGVLAGPDTGLRVGARVRGHIDPPSGPSMGYAAVRWSLGTVEGEQG